MRDCILHVTISIAILSFAFGQSSPQQNSENSKSEQEVRQIIEKFRSALLKGDVPTLQQIWANDYLFVNPSGEVLTKEQRLANIRSGATKLEAINQQEDTKIRVYQNSAVSTSRETVKGHYSGQPNSGQYRVTSVWVKSSEGWQLVSTQMTPVAPSKPEEIKSEKTHFSWWYVGLGSGHGKSAGPGTSRPSALQSASR